MKIEYSKEFQKNTRLIPKRVLAKMASLIDIFIKNPYDKKLHTKALKGALTGYYSFRITREYRVLFHFLESNKVSFLSIEHRKDIYR